MDEKHKQNLRPEDMTKRAMKSLFTTQMGSRFQKSITVLMCQKTLASGKHCLPTLDLGHSLPWVTWIQVTGSQVLLVGRRISTRCYP